MTSERHMEIRVGILLIAALVILVGGLLWFQEFRFRSEILEIQVLFDNVGGLGEGDPVHVRGLPLGKVAQVDLVPEGVLVLLEVRSSAGLTDQATFRLSAQGLVGERLVSVDPGRGEPLPAGSTRVFAGESSLSIPDLVGRAEELNDQVMAFLREAQGTLQELRQEGGVTDAVGEATRASKAVADVLEENADELGRAARSMANVGERLERFLESHEESLGQGVDGLARSAASLDTLVAELSRVAEGAQDVLLALREQRGAAGRMIYDEEMGKDVEESVANLKFLLEDLKRNPQRYLTVKIF